jgi:hypothetical protein
LTPMISAPMGRTTIFTHEATGHTQFTTEGLAYGLLGPQLA